MRIKQFRLELDHDRMPVMVMEAVHECEYPVTSPDKVAQLCNEAFGLNRRAEEHVLLLAMGSDGPIALFEVAHGQVNGCRVGAVEVLKRLLLCGTATGGILIHNHPSGHLPESVEDTMLCNRMLEAFQIVGLNLYDFMIVAGDSYKSFRDDGKLE